MQKGKYVLDQVLSLSQTKVDLPTRNIIDGIILTVEATYTNSDDTNAVSLTDEQLAAAIPEIRVVSDGANTHYALSLADILVMNYYDTAGKVPSLDTANSIAASGSLTKKFTVRLDGGDIVAAVKQSLAISIQTNPTVAPTVSLTDLSITITIDEIVIQDLMELIERYGENLEYMAEPKITATEVNASANTSFTGLAETPVGNAIIRSFYIAKTTAGVRDDTIIDKYGMVDRNSTVLYKIPFTTGQHLDEQEYNIDSALTGITILDYAEEMAPKDGISNLFDPAFGVKGWNYAKGDYLDAFKINTTGKIRIIRHELICADGLKAIIDDLPDNFGGEIIDEGALPDNFE